jgi:CRISPR-associated exonuclease Cas4
MEDDFLPISALQHYLYCPRQCALIHIERQWAENRQTAEGRVLHERVDQAQGERRHGVRTVTALPLAHAGLGIAGVADVVEFHRVADGEQAYPVEYKLGRPKAHRADEVQLCAQALCLEEMLGREVSAGALFYGKTRRRCPVAFDPALRQLTVATIKAVKALVSKGETPRAAYERARCDTCSLIDVCCPKLRQRSVGAWLQAQVGTDSCASN